MVAKRGKHLLLKIDADGGGNFTTIAGLRARTIVLNTTPVDATHLESAGRWREFLAGAGLRSVQISGGGIFRDGQSDALVNESFFSSSLRNWQIIIPEFGRLSGPFFIQQLEYGAVHDREVTFEMTIASGGEVIFVPL